MPAIACEFAKANSVSNEVTTNAGTSKSEFSECTQLVKIERYIFFGERQPFYFRSEGFLSPNLTYKVIINSSFWNKNYGCK